MSACSRSSLFSPRVWCVSVFPRGPSHIRSPPRAKHAYCCALFYVVGFVVQSFADFCCALRFSTLCTTLSMSMSAHCYRLTQLSMTTQLPMTINYQSAPHRITEDQISRRASCSRPRLIYYLILVSCIEQYCICIYCVAVHALSALLLLLRRRRRAGRRACACAAMAMDG